MGKGLEARSFVPRWFLLGGRTIFTASADSDTIASKTFLGTETISSSEAAIKGGTGAQRSKVELGVEVAERGVPTRHAGLERHPTHAYGA